MIRGHFKLGRVFGIEIELHISWFIIAALLTTSLAAHLHAVNSDWSNVVIWTAAGVTALAFFAAILLHELSHAAVGRARGVPVSTITLFALGGVARTSRDAEDARTEFWMALAGPIMSVLIGAGALAVAALLGWDRDATPRTPGMVMLVWFGLVNLGLAAFNMIPGFPLDGGRVLRALVWWQTGNRVRATRLSAGLGEAIGAGLIGVGLLSFLRGGNVGGMWLALIGLFLSGAARATRMETNVMEGLKDVRVADVMSRDWATVAATTFLSDLAEQVRRTGRRCFFVSDGERVAGMVTTKELRAVPRDKWMVTSASTAMRPVEGLRQIDADAPVTQAIEVIGREDAGQVPVLDHGQIRGVISREQIQRLLTARAELAA